MKLRRLFHIKKSRKYPIKRDKEGLSLRARSFELFDQGKRPFEVADELKIPIPTACRYYRDWKKLGPNFKQLYDHVKSFFKKTAPDREKNMELFARIWGISREQLEAILVQPHGLRRLLTGKLYLPGHADVDYKKYVALELALLFSDHWTKNSGKFEDVFFAFKRYMQENMKYREEEDADIKQDNELMKLVHAILAKEMENEREGRIKPDTLSDEERNIAIKRGIEIEKKKTELSYWLRIGALMVQGLSREEAREKIYKDVLDKCDPKTVNIFREFQNKIDPIKINDHLPPPSPLQPPSST
jgi:hypothetical protein